MSNEVSDEGGAPKLLGACVSCGRRFRVPRKEATFKCKHCGGLVRALTPETGTGSITAPQPGAPVGVAVPTRKAGHAPGTRVTGEELKQLQAVRMVLVANLLTYVVLMLILLLVGVTGPPDVGWLVLYAVLAVFAVGYLAASILFAVHPLFWTVALASGSTLNVAYWLSQGQIPVWVMIVTAGLWCMIPIALRLRRLQREQPANYLSHAFAGTLSERPRLRVHGAGSEEDHAALIARSRRRAVVRAAVSCVAFALLAVGAAWWRVGGRSEGAQTAADVPRGFDEVLDRFESAWRASDVETVGDLFAGSQRAENRGELREGVARRGWRGALPALSERVLEEDGESVVLEWKTGAGAVRAKASATDREWCLDELLLPPVPMDEFVARFRAAWNEGSTEDVLACFPKERAESIRAGLVTLKEERRWSAERPKLSSCEPVAQPWDRGELRCAFDGGVLVVPCRLVEILRWQADSVGVHGN